MIKYRLGIISLIITIIAFTTSCGEKKKEDPAAVTETKPAVVEASGKVKAFDTINITLDFSATVQAVSVKQGQILQKGDVLFTIDNSTVLSEIAKKENELASKKVNLQKQQSSLSGNTDLIKNQISAEEIELARLKEDKDNKDKDRNNKIENLKAKQNLAQENLNNAQNDFNTQKELFNNGIISKSTLDQYELTLKEKQNSMQNAQSEMESAEISCKKEIAEVNSLIVQSQTKISNYRIELSNPKEVTANDIEIAKIEIENIELAINDLKDKISKPYLDGNKVICPVDQAVVGEIKVKIGDSTANNISLASLIDNANLYVEAEVDEESANEVKVGSNVLIKPVSNNIKQYHGKVVRIADLGVERNGSTVILTEISIDDRDEGIQSGYNVDVDIDKE